MDQKTAIRQLKELERLGGVKKMRLAAEGWREEWQTLISILMSARTRDEVTVIVAENLFAEFSTLDAIGKANPRDISRVIGPVNFFQNKTKYVIAISKILHEKHGGKPPRTIEELITLPGVGRKTANVFLAEYGADAIGVDTHVSYISQKLGWTSHTDPDKIEQDLLMLFPQAQWRELNSTLVRFGKTYQSRIEKNRLLEKIGKI
ncbi:MAG: endonuclease III [Candidatus Taylorbacteria bacterium]|nr:endonuclease III [Candidatus Taylorbacteria bacterium]